MFKQITSIITYLVIMVIFVLPFSCKQEIKKSDKTTGEDERFDYLIKQSKTFDYANSYDTALMYGDSAYSYAINLKDEKKIAWSFLRKGSVFQSFYKYDSSKVYLNNAILFSEKVGDSLCLGLSLNMLGNTYKEIGSIDEAIEKYIGAKTIYSRMHDERRLAYVLLNIGNIHLHIANLHHSVSEYKKALELYEKCKTVSVKAENYSMIMVSSGNIAIVYNKLKQYDKAEHAYLEVIELNKNHNDDNLLARNYTNLAHVYADDNRQELGFIFINKAIQLAKKTKQTKIELRAYNYLGIYYSDKGDYQKAEKYYIKSITLAKEIGDNINLKNAYNNLSLLIEERGDFEEALAYFKLRSELSDSLINERKLEIIYELESKYEKKKDEAEILRLSNENAEKEIHNKDLKIVLLTVVSIVILLIGILFFIRLKNRKDKIIAKQRIQQLEEEQKLLAAQSVIVGQENERKRVAQELHDGIGVLLSTASIHFSNVEESSADEKTVQMLHKANKLLKQAGGEVRKISHDMMPGVLSKFGLQEALEDIFENVEDTGNIEVDCDIELGEERLNENTEIIMYRIIQEILNNTLKHAHAKHISFTMKKQVGNLVINYKDDGDGFDQNNIQAEKSLGLSGIKSRIDFLKGEMKLISSPAKGVQYDIIIPVE